MLQTHFPETGIMNSPSYSLVEIQRRINEVQQFLSVTLSIANAHTVEFYTHDVWKQFVCVAPEEVLLAVTSFSDHQAETQHNGKGQTQTMYGFCNDTKRLIDTRELLQAAKAHSLPGLGVCLTRDGLLQALSENQAHHGALSVDFDAELEPDEFMNAKKSHEVQSMSEVVGSLSQHCGVKQVIDVGSGKGYLSSFLSLRYGLQVYGIDSSITNTHSAQERNRKLKKFSRAYQKHSKAVKTQGEQLGQDRTGMNGSEDFVEKVVSQKEEEERLPSSSTVTSSSDISPVVEMLSDMEPSFLSVLSADVIQPAAPRVHPSQLSAAERERRKKENLERKAKNHNTTAVAAALFSPLTSYVTAETELREIITELEGAVMVGLHTCGDLAPSMLRMFVAKPELASVCSVGCCYHLLSEEFDPARQECVCGVFGFPMSQHLRAHSGFCGRNARMSACLALERVSHGQGIQMESLFYRAVLHVILRDHYGSFKSEKRVGNVYSKAKSFVDYVRRALIKLELDESKLSDNLIQGYHDAYQPRMDEMYAFNMLKVTLAPSIEGLILLDRLCYLKEQEEVRFSALVQLFDPVLSPRCYGIVGVKERRDR